MFLLNFKIKEKLQMDKTKKLLLFDFDGVIHSYKSGWCGIDNIPDPPVNGIREMLKELRKNYTIKIFSTRCLSPKGIKAMKDYLKKYDIEVDGFTKTKEKSFLTVDDRSINFNGDCEDVLEKITNFKVWNRK
jgi:hypothetical protein